MLDNNLVLRGKCHFENFRESKALQIQEWQLSKTNCL